MIDGIPHNTHAVIEADVELQGGAHDIDIPMVTLTGSRRLNGSPAIFVAGSGLLRLEHPETGDIASFGDFPSTDQFAVEIVPGMYDIIYDVGVVIEGIPHNTHAIIEADAELLGGAHNVNIPMVTITGSRTINGQSVIVGANSGLLKFVNTETGDIANVGGLDSDTYSVELVPGTYDIVYDVGELVDGIPHNTHAIVEAGVDLQGGVHDIDIPMHTLSGTRTINGQSVAMAGSGVVRFIGPDGLDNFRLGEFESASYGLELIPGNYQVVYDVGNLVDGIPHNTRAVLECVQVQ